MVSLIWSHVLIRPLYVAFFLFFFLGLPLFAASACVSLCRSFRLHKTRPFSHFFLPLKSLQVLTLSFYLFFLTCLVIWEFEQELRIPRRYYGREQPNGISQTSLLHRCLWARPTMNLGPRLHLIFHSVLIFLNILRSKKIVFFLYFYI